LPLGDLVHQGGIGFGQFRRALTHHLLEVRTMSVQFLLCTLALGDVTVATSISQEDTLWVAHRLAGVFDPAYLSIMSPDAEFDFSRISALSVATVFKPRLPVLRQD
jgi:hypothetical protein